MLRAPLDRRRPAQKVPLLDPTPVAGFTSTTRGLPAVTVPVLSSTTVVTRAAVSRASPP